MPKHTFLLAMGILGASLGTARANPTVGVGTASGNPGATVTLPVNLTADPSTPIAALQFVLTLPSGWTLVSAAAGPAATAASKTTSMNAANSTVIVYGTNQTVISSGVVANLGVTISAAASSGTYPISIGYAIASDPTGYAVTPITSAGSVAIGGSTPPPSAPTINSFSASPSTITAGGGSTLSWNVSGATSLNVSGIGTVTGSSTPVSPSSTTSYTLTATNAGGAVSASTTVTVSSSTGGTTSAAQSVFVPAAPCRIADTRNTAGPFGGPELSANSTRSFNPVNSGCAIPATATAYSLNVTVVPNAPLGYLTIWPTGQSQPTVSTLNSPMGQVIANAAIVPAGTGGAITVYVTDPTHLVLDINGYFVPKQ